MCLRGDNTPDCEQARWCKLILAITLSCSRTEERSRREKKKRSEGLTYIDATITIGLGEKMEAKRPASGAQLETAMRNDEVNQDASSYASSSAAMTLCAIVMPLMLLASDTGSN